MKKIIYSAGVLVVLGSFLFGGVAYANMLFFSSTARTATATTTPTYLVRNTTIATTTSPIYDAFEQNGTNQTNQAQIQPVESAVLEVQFTASSTSSVLGWYYEYSDREGVNCGTNPNGCDWYSDNLISPGRLSTSTISNVSGAYTQTWTFASSTVGGIAPAANNNRDMKIFNVSVPTRYVRVVFYCNSATNCAVWAKWVPIKQTPE